MSFDHMCNFATTSSSWSINLVVLKLFPPFHLVPLTLPSYLSCYDVTSRLRNWHLDSLSLVSSLVHRSSQSSNSPLFKSLFYRAHLLWNSLPFVLREIQSPSLFKSEFIKHLWTSLVDKECDAFSDPDEFD